MIDIFFVSDLLGSCAFAFSGFLLGVRKRLDLMGIFIVSMLTANGGGAVRDVLVGNTPQVLTNPMAFYVVLSLLIISIIFRLQSHSHLERKMWFVVSDSIGLVAFSITGAMVGLDNGLSIFGVLVLAFLTAVGGGIIRDTLVQETPSVLKEGFYGSVAILIALVLYVLNRFDVLNEINVLLVFVIALVVRLLAHLKDWHLPRITPN
jgi:uncharacterized membrane protein YeiH